MNKMDQYLESKRIKREKLCIAFCEGAPDEALNPGGLMRSFHALTLGGDVLECLNLAVEYERIKAENLLLKKQVQELTEELHV